MDNLKEEISRVEKLVNEKMDALLPTEVEGRIGENRLARAMRYSALAGGKRIRPFILLQTANLFGVSESCSLMAAAAIEFIHCFSLVHDDLPALDNDDERRGQASLHKKFDEATAILTGDALLTYAFEVLSHETTHYEPSVRLELISCIARATGANGMIGGQMIDILSEQRDLNMDQITRLQRMKTGQLFQASCEAGAILGKATRNARMALRGYASNLGLVFQITDDLLDATVERNEDGSSRKNKSEEKGTYIAVLGVDKAKQQAEILTTQAKEHLKTFGKCEGVNMLSDLADMVLNRSK